MSRGPRRRVLLALGAAAAGGPVVPVRSQEANRLRVEVNGQVLGVALLDNPTSRDLLSLLPLELTAKDHAATEAVAYPPRKLSTRSAPAAHTPVAGDFAYYAPWGNLALFHADGHPSPGLVLLGRITGPLQALRLRGEVKLTIVRGA